MLVRREIKGSDAGEKIEKTYLCQIWIEEFSQGRLHQIRPAASICLLYWKGNEIWPTGGCWRREVVYRGVL